MELGAQGFRIIVRNGGQRLASRSEHFSSGVLDNQRSQKSTGGDGAKGKGKGHPTTGHKDPDGEEMYSSTLSLTSVLDGVGGQRHAPTALPPGTRYSFYRRLGGPQGRSGRVRKISSSTPGYDPRIAQTVASRSTD